ncbi:hypothetical protein KGM_203858 [Danaus plexippus plexippus]|uniref:C2H2-type domain-containing protein n=1 Tax=Danaus plexippus plexippus TaxID=278856 RepID=A0A212F8M6_DANPL|nr:hypothetical protein KGM_203858 [Danaus plexippus plexippus]
MSYCCSQCSFTAQFESALIMHRQLHHDSSEDFIDKHKRITSEKSNTMPLPARLDRSFTNKEKGMKLSARNSATRLLGKLKDRICRSKMFVHQEEAAEARFTDLSGQSECTSKALKELGSSVSGVLESLRDNKETFACHLCSFDADRITVLDRHLLNDHKIGLDNLLKLVMAKTKDGLAEDNPAQMYGLRQAYYRPADEILESDEFIIETVTPKIKILKHAVTNTDLKWTDIPDILDCKTSEENEKFVDDPADNDLLEKMQTLNECMYKFVDSSNTLKKVLTKEFQPKSEKNESYYNLGLGDRESPRNWEKAHSEKLVRNQGKFPESR